MRFMTRGAEPPSDQSWEAHAYRLASFIHNCLGDEERHKVAFEIAKEAIRKLPSIASKQKKRNLFKLKGQPFRSPDPPPSAASGADAESKIKGKVRSKITLRRVNLFQCLVLRESEKFERGQEESACAVPLDQEDMLVRYLAYLVRFSMEKSSFYVNLGLCRFVYDYSAGETEGLYNFVIQDSPDRYKDGEYFRKRKGTMKDDLQRRFGAHLNIVTGKRGEDHFQREEEPEQYCDLLKLCLSEFQPWEVSCCLPPRFNANDDLPMLKPDPKQHDDSDVELKRMHALLHPDCFGKLVGAKRHAEPDKYEAPEACLGLPHFFLNGDRTTE